MQQQSENQTQSQYYTLPKLPYEYAALEPVISKETLHFHYDKHHTGYVEKLNKLIAGTPLENFPLDEVVKRATGKLYNNAAQTWNHTFYWNCMTPDSSELKSGKLFEAIESSFGSMDQFKSKFQKCGEDLFGSGYVWLVKDGSGKLLIKDGKDAYNPMTESLKPLLTCDVWEHAYYLDYQNLRKEYLQKFWEIVNWDFVESQLSSH